jgi:hypothetical protein
MPRLNAVSRGRLMAEALFQYQASPCRIYNINNIYLTAIGLSPSGSGFEHIYK